MQLFQNMRNILDIILGWPSIIFVFSISIACTFVFCFVQFRYFFKAWKYTLFPEKSTEKTTGKVDMTPFQAFVMTLSANIGNGSLAGMATAIYSGGPGAAFWVVVSGFIMMSVRYAEVFLSAYVALQRKTKSAIGGPMLYLKLVPGGKYLAYMYAVSCVLLGFFMGNAMQTNSIGLAAFTTWGISPLTISLISFVFIIFVMFGGAKRIVQFSDFVMPIKVGLFILLSFTLLIYHWQNIIPSLILIFKSAFSSQAMAGGALGFSVQQAMRFGLLRGIAATESGLGTAAILFSSTSSKDPVKTGLMSILTTFISTCVCLIIALCIVASGAHTTGLTSTALTISAFSTVFGQFAGWAVNFLSIMFGVGVIISFAYIFREMWAYITGGRFMGLCSVVYCIGSFCGPLMTPDFVFMISDMVVVSMLIINLIGVVYLLPLMKKELKAFEKQQG